MNQFILFAASEGGGIMDIAKSTGDQFGFHWQLFISQIISFVVVVIALQKFAYKPILTMLEQRRETIAQGLANAEKIKAELANAQAKSQELLTAASVQANKIIEEARSAAAKISEVEAQKAVSAASDIIAKAKQSNEAEFKRLEAELKREIGTLAVRAAMQVSGKILTADDQKRLAEETNRQLAA